MLGDILSYFGTLAAVSFATFVVAGLAATFTWMVLWLACWLPNNWSDMRSKVRTKDHEVAEMYVITACIFWARVAFALGVFYVLTEGCRDEVQRLLGPLLRLVDSF